MAITQGTPEQRARYRVARDKTRQEYARRSGLAPASIDLDVWLRCEQFATGKSDRNCAFAILSTEDITLPDHVCPEVEEASVDAYLRRRHPSADDVARIGWHTLVPEIPEPVRVRRFVTFEYEPFIIVERLIPGGTATLFGILEPVRGDDPSDFDAWMMEIIEPQVPSSGTGADLARTMRSWYDSTFRGLKSGRPGAAPADKTRLRALFTRVRDNIASQLEEAPAADDDEDAPKLTVAAVAEGMGYSVSTLQRMYREWGIISRPTYWYQEWLEERKRGH